MVANSRLWLPIRARLRLVVRRRGSARRALVVLIQDENRGPLTTLEAGGVVD